jgi:hypothetical protein
MILRTFEIFTHNGCLIGVPVIRFMDVGIKPSSEEKYTAQNCYPPSYVKMHMLFNDLYPIDRIQDIHISDCYIVDYRRFR